MRGVLSTPIFLPDNDILCFRDAISFPSVSNMLRVLHSSRVWVRVLNSFRGEYKLSLLLRKSELGLVSSEALRDLCFHKRRRLGTRQVYCVD